MISAATILVLVAGVGQASVDFDTQIVPVLTRSGCNVGSCHGAAAGRGGFHLSLLGGDAQADYAAIVEQYEGRRINLAVPEKSLLLNKPTMQLDHEGGEALAEDGAKLIREWLNSGARRITTRKLQSLDIQPARHLENSVGVKVPLKIIAHFDNGADEDVTRWTVFVSSDPSAISVDAETNVATIHRRGQHTIVARYLDRVVPMRFSVPLADTPIDHRSQPRGNFIDDHILQTLTELRLTVSPRASDATFLRRVYLDLTGRLPSREMIETFLAASSTDNRKELVDRLLGSEDFVNYWTYRFANLFRVLPQPNDHEGARAYHNWLRTQIKQHTPMNQMAKELLTAIGDTHQYGPANFARTSSDARAQAELVSQVFMGTRLQCANCHNHPLDRWTQDDYHGLAAVFARLDRGQVVKLASRGAVTNVRTGEPAVPRIPGLKYLPIEQDNRHEFADWMVSPENPYFAMSFVNRIWRGMFGRGLVEPADDMRDTNAATHPELLDELARDFIDHGFDLRHAIRRIAVSEVYGRSGATDATNRLDDRFYSHAYPRPLEPEVLADAIFDVTGVADKYGDEPDTTRAIELFNVLTPSETLDVLGRCSRTESCEGVAVAGGLPTRLHLLNGNLVNRKVTAPQGRLHQWIAAHRSDQEILTEMYLRAFSRHPTATELEHWRGQISEAGKENRPRMLEDIFWGILNCSEFTSNR